MWLGPQPLHRVLSPNHKPYSFGIPGPVPCGSGRKTASGRAPDADHRRGVPLRARWPCGVDLPAQSREARIAALLGTEAAAALLPVNGERVSGEAVLRLSGFACAPLVTRATAAAQTLVVNGRPVADPALLTMKFT